MVEMTFRGLFLHLQLTPVPHISLVFREMSNTTMRTGAPCSHQRTWD